MRSEKDTSQPGKQLTNACPELQEKHLRLKQRSCHNPCQSFDFEYFSFGMLQLLSNLLLSFTLFPEDFASFAAIKKAEVLLHAPSYKTTSGKHSPPAVSVTSMMKGETDPWGRSIHSLCCPCSQRRLLCRLICGGHLTE